MKAKEYFEKYLNFQMDQKEKDAAIWELYKAMSLEIMEIAKIRNARKGGAMLSILQEQNRKWNALIKFDSSIKRDGFITTWMGKLGG